MASFPLYCMRVGDFLALETLRSHEDLLVKGLIMRADRLEAPSINFVSHQWISTRHPDPDSVHLRTMQEVFRRVIRGENIFADDDVAAKFLTGRSRARSSSSDVLTTRERTFEEFQRSVSEGWVWLDYFSVPQRAGAEEEQAKAITSIPTYVAQASNFWVCTPLGVRRESGHQCNFDTWLMRGWCRMEALALDLTRMSEGRPIYLTHHLGEEPSASTQCFHDRLNLGWQRRKAVLTGDFARLSDREGLHAVIRELYHSALDSLRSVWEPLVESGELPRPMWERYIASADGADGGAYHSFFLLVGAEAYIFADLADEEHDQSYWEQGDFALDGSEDAVKAWLLHRGEYAWPPDECWAWYAAIVGNLALFRFLIEELGFDIGAVNKYGMTPLTISANWGNISLVRYIVERTDAAHVLYKTPGLGLSAVGVAAKNGHHRTLSFLLQSKADVEVTRNDNQRTPLHEAAANGNEECIRLLLGAGSSTAARDGAGFTAAELAGKYGAMKEDAERVKLARLFEC